jgi:hypothetical protein
MANQWNMFFFVMATIFASLLTLWGFFYGTKLIASGGEIEDTIRGVIIMIFIAISWYIAYMLYQRT